MKQEIDVSHFLSSHFHECVDLGIVLNVQWLEKRCLARVFCSAFRNPHAIFLFFVLRFVRQMRKTANAAVFHDLSSDCPSDRPIVCNPKNQSLLAFE